MLPSAEKDSQLISGISDEALFSYLGDVAKDCLFWCKIAIATIYGIAEAFTNPVVTFFLFMLGLPLMFGFWILGRFDKEFAANIESDCAAMLEAPIRLLKFGAPIALLISMFNKLLSFFFPPEAIFATCGVLAFATVFIATIRFAIHRICHH